MLKGSMLVILRHQATSDGFTLPCYSMKATSFYRELL